MDYIELIPVLRDIIAGPVIAGNFQSAFPNDSVLVCQSRVRGARYFHGIELVDIKVYSRSYLWIYKLTKSSGVTMKSDEIKAAAFPFVDDSKNITDDEQRCNRLRDQLGNTFPDHNVNVFIFNNDSSFFNSNNTKGATYFKNDYGSEVAIFLN